MLKYGPNFFIDHEEKGWVEGGLNEFRSQAFEEPELPFFFDDFSEDMAEGVFTCGPSVLLSGAQEGVWVGEEGGYYLWNGAYQKDDQARKLLACII